MKEENIFTYNLFAIKYFRKGHPSPQLFVYCLTRNTLLTFFCSDEQCTLKVKQISSTYCWLVLILLLCVYVFLQVLFHISAIMKLQIPSYLYLCKASYLASHGIILLRIIGCCCFLVSQ